MNYVNLTPHTINFTDGRSFVASGTVARVAVSYGDIINDITEQKYGDVVDLPAPAEGTIFIVSALVLAALKGGRADVVAPATGHPGCKRNEKGQIEAVPCFTR